MRAAHLQACMLGAGGGSERTRFDSLQAHSTAHPSTPMLCSSPLFLFIRAVPLPPGHPCRVKVVDKRVRGGRLYLKKGTIVDVKAPTGAALDWCRC